MTNNRDTHTEQDAVSEQLDRLAARIEEIRRQAESPSSTEEPGSRERVHTPEPGGEPDKTAADEVASDRDTGESGEPTAAEQSQRNQQEHPSGTASAGDGGRTAPDETRPEVSATREQPQEETPAAEAETDDTAPEGVDTTDKATGEEDTTLVPAPINSDVSTEELHSLLSAVDQFIDTIRLFKQQIGLFEERIESNTDDIGTLQNTSVDITEQMTNLVELVDTQDEELSEIQRSLAQYREAVTDYEQDVDGLQADVQSNRTTISDIRDDNLAFREKLASVRNEVIDTQQDLSALQQSVETIDAELDELHAQDSRLTSQVETLDQATDELATDIADIESDINSLRNRTVTVDGEDLLIRAAIRELSRRQLSTEEVASIAHQQAAETTAEVEEQLTNVQAAIEEVASREDTRMNIANEITSLRREVQSLKQNTDTNTETDTERRADTDTAEDDPVLVEPGQSDLRQNVRELQRENRAIKELIEGLNHNGQ